MRKKLLMAIALLVSGVGNLWAQTDVTSTYIANADFSGDRSEYTLPSGNTALSSNRCIYKPAGWDISVKNKNQYNYSVVKPGDKLQTTDFNSEPYIPTGGKYMVRFRNGNNESEHITLSQTFTISVPGVYEFSADLIREDGSKIDVTFSAAGSSVSNSSAGVWQTKSFEKIITTSTEITVSLKFSNKATSGDNMKRAGADDVKIVYKKNLNGETLAALIAQATSINTRTVDLTSAISTAQGVYDAINNTPDYQDDIDDAISTLRSAIETSLGSYAGLNGAGDDVTAFIANADFETSPIFDGTANGTLNSANATATTGSTTKPLNSINAYNIAGWELKTNTSSDYARAFTMPYNNTLYVQSDGKIGNQTITSPTNGSSVTTSNNSLLLIHSSWCNTLVNTIEQTIPLPAGSYRLTFDSYVSTTISNAESRCGISYGATPTTVYRWPSDLNTWTANVIDFELAEQTNVTFSLGYKKTADQGAGSTPVLFVDNLKLTYYNELGLAKVQWQDAKAKAEATIANGDYDNVTGSERTSLQAEIAKSEPSTKEGYNTATSDMETAISTFTAAKNSYDNLVTTRTAGESYTTSAWPYASSDKKTALDEAISASPTNAADAVTKANAIVTAYRAFVESNAKAEAVTGAVNMTSSIENANATQGDKNAVVQGSKWAWSITDSNISRTADNPLTDSEGNTMHYINYYNAAASWTTSITQSINIPAGRYILSASGRASSSLAYFRLKAGANTKDMEKVNGDANAGTFGNGWNDNYLVFDHAGGSITIGVEGQGSNTWMCFTRVRLYQIGDAATLTVKANKWGTFIAPFDVEIPTGVNAYTVTGVSGTSIEKSDALDTTIPANTPVILENTNGEDYSNTFYGAIHSDDSYTSGLLTGVYTAATIAASDGSNTRYVLQTQEDVQAFYKVTSAFTPSPNRCYLTVPVASGVKAFYLDGDETAVSSVKADELQGATIYNLAGQRVSKAQKGVYIINGKKVAVK